MHFENVQWFWLLAAAPALLLLGRVRTSRRQKLLGSFVDRDLESRVVPRAAQVFQTLRRHALWACIAALLMAAVMMRPQYGFTWKESSKKGVDIVIAVDVSESMLANDVKPSRLERARREIVDLIEEFRGDRVGLVAFAGVGFTETPLTLDYGTLLSFVSALSPTLIPVKGTNIESAVTEGIKTLEKGTAAPSENAQTQRSRAIILITDGEQFDGDLPAVAKLAEEKNVKLYIIGVGTIEGGPIPTPKGYKKDKNGKVVITKFSPAGLQDLAAKTGGVFVTSIGSDQDTKAIYSEGIHQQLTGSEVNWARAKRYHEYFQLPLLAAILVLLFGPWGALGGLSRRKTVEPITRGLSTAIAPAAGTGTASAKAMIMVAFTLLYAGNVQAQLEGHRAETAGAEGSKAYEDGNFEDALEKFDEGAARRKDDARFLMGKGASAYRLGRFEDANRAFTDANVAAPDVVSQSQALYNSGNSLVQLEQYQRAIDVYEKSLKLAPNDPDTLENLAYARKLLEQKQQQKEDQKNQQQKQKQDQKKQDEQKKQNQEQQEDQKDKKDQQDNQSSDDQSKSDQPEDGKSQEQQSKDQQSTGSENNEQNQSEQQDQQSKSDEQKAAERKANEQQQQDQSKQDSKDPEDGKSGQPQPGDDQKQDQNKDDSKDGDAPPEPKADEQGKPGTGKKHQQEKKSDSPGDKQQSDGDSTGGGDDSGEKQEQQLSSEARTKLDSVEEKRNARFNYRFNKAMQQLKQNHQPLPDKDW